MLVMLQVLLVGVPAAFDLIATFHIPDYIEMAEEIKSKGVEVRCRPSNYIQHSFIGRHKLAYRKRLCSEA